MAPQIRSKDRKKPGLALTKSRQQGVSNARKSIVKRRSRPSKRYAHHRYSTYESSRRKARLEELDNITNKLNKVSESTKEMTEKYEALVVQVKKAEKKGLEDYDKKMKLDQLELKARQSAQRRYQRRKELKKPHIYAHKAVKMAVKGKTSHVDRRDIDILMKRAKIILAKY